MADISKITLPNGSAYDLKDARARKEPVDSRTYTDVIASANAHNGASFFYLKVRGTTYNTKWHVKVRVHASVPSNYNYDTETEYDIWARQNTYIAYSCLNQIYNASYRPIYFNSIFHVSATGHDNGCGSWLGFNLYSSTNPTNASFKRTVVVDLISYEGCTVEFSDSLIKSANIPNLTAHANWYSSTNSSFSNFDAYQQGLKQIGDANTTTISNLSYGNGSYVANSALYRYQMLFQMDENTLTPLNNANNVTGTTKTILTDVEFDAFGRIFYWASTSTVAASGNIGAGGLCFAYNGIDARYTFNITSTSFTAQRMLYLVVTPQSNGKVKLASASPWSVTLPTSNDGKWYILLGRTYSGYTFVLYPDHPVYYHDGTKIQRVSPCATTEASTNYDITTPSFSSLPQTFYSSDITANHKVVCNAVHLSNPKAGDIDWTVTCANGSLTISGTFHGSTATTATMSLWIPAKTITLTTS